jgi:hypothetical protein
VVAGMFMAIFEVSSATPDLSSSPNPFATMQSHWALKFLKIRPTLKIDFWGETPSLEKNSQQPLPCWLTSVPLRTVSLREGRGVGGILKF